jgi:hypothetical protein
MDYGLMFFNGYTTSTPTPVPVRFPSVSTAIYHAELSLLWWVIRTVFIYIIVRDVLLFVGGWVLNKVKALVHESLLYAMNAGTAAVKQAEKVAEQVEEQVEEVLGDAVEAVKEKAIDLTGDAVEFVADEVTELMDTVKKSVQKKEVVA